MLKSEMNAILSNILEKEDTPYDPPTEKDWEKLKQKFGCQFETEFKYFIELMAVYDFPGDIYNVSSGNTNGNDDVAFIYDYEIEHKRWNPDMIPFYGIGNGDYFCISIKACPHSPVYYHYHDRGSYEQLYENFTEWVLDLPDFLE